MTSIAAKLRGYGRAYDVRSSDLAFGLASAGAVMLLSVVILVAARMVLRSEARESDEIAVRVKPVVDPGQPTPVTTIAAPPPASQPTMPSRPQPREPARDKPSPLAQPAPETPLPAVADAPAVPELPADAEPSPADAPPSDPIEGPPADDEPSAGEGDPLTARAVAMYRARLTAWLSARFRVRGSGLDQAELLRHRVRAVLMVDDDLVVTGYELKASGHEAFDIAARTALESVVGSTLPPPPDNYPGTVQQRISVTFACREDSCD